MRKNIFGDEIYKDGVVVNAGNITIYTSHEGYNELMKEVFNQLKMDLENKGIDYGPDYVDDKSIERKLVDKTPSSVNILPTLKEIVKDNTVYFDSYRAGFFYYHVTVNNKIYQFTVDREDIGDATLKANDKALYFMRWIRKAIEGNQFILIADNSLPDSKCDKCGASLIARLEFFTGECDNCMFPQEEKK